MNDISKQLQEQIQQAYSDQQCLQVKGNDSKHFLGHTVEGEALNVQDHCGIIDYQPTELTLKTRAGTSLQEISTLLTQNNQTMGFNPPQFTPQSTIGGSVAAKQSGPQAPFNGSIRDAILGIRLLDGQGNILEFGGQVMKNVAGYDVSRFISGSYGTLGILLDITFRVHPIPAKKITLCLSVDKKESLTLLAEWIRKSIPVSAACHVNQQLHIELTGTERSLHKYLALEGTLQVDESAAQEYWSAIRDHRHEFFRPMKSTENLWRLIVPATTALADLQGEWLFDWAGSQRWFISNQPSEKIRDWTRKVKGYATLFKSGNNNNSSQIEIFEPLAPALAALHQRIKSRFDPGLILNRGKMYPVLDNSTTPSTRKKTQETR